MSLILHSDGYVQIGTINKFYKFMCGDRRNYKYSIQRLYSTAGLLYLKMIQLD